MPSGGAPSGWRPFALLTLLLLSLVGAAPGAIPPAEREIRRVLSEQEAAWNRGDLESFLSAYWRSDSLTFYSGGDVSRGWQAAHDRYFRRYGGKGNEMGRLRFTLHEIELLDRSHALVKGAWHLTKTVGDSGGLFTLVLRRFPRAGWKIVHDHTSLGS